MFFFISKFSLPLNFMNESVCTLHSVYRYFLHVRLHFSVAHCLSYSIEMVAPSGQRELQCFTNFCKFNWTKTKIRLINFRIHWFFVWAKEVAFIIVNWEWENFWRQKLRAAQKSSGQRKLIVKMSHWHSFRFEITDCNAKLFHRRLGSIAQSKANLLKLHSLSKAHNKCKTNKTFSHF